MVTSKFFASFSVLILSFLIVACGKEEGSDSRAKEVVGSKFQTYQSRTLSMALGTICAGNQPARVETDFDLGGCGAMPATELEQLRGIGPLSVQVSDDGRRIRVASADERVSGEADLQEGGLFEVPLASGIDFTGVEGCDAQLSGKAVGRVLFAKQSSRVERIDVSLKLKSCSCGFGARQVALSCE